MPYRHRVHRPHHCCHYSYHRCHHRRPPLWASPRASPTVVRNRRKTRSRRYKYVCPVYYWHRVRLKRASHQGRLRTHGTGQDGLDRGRWVRRRHGRCYLGRHRGTSATCRRSFEIVYAEVLTFFLYFWFIWSYIVVFTTYFVLISPVRVLTQVQGNIGSLKSCIRVFRLLFLNLICMTFYQHHLMVFLLFFLFKKLGFIYLYLFTFIIFLFVNN